jgi:TolB protein
MKKLYSLMLVVAFAAAENVELTVSGAQQAHMPIAIMVLDETSDELNAIAAVIKKDLEFTGQFKPYIKKLNAELPKKQLRKEIKTLCAQQKTPLAICINTTSPKTIEWRLYDTMECTMIVGKKYKKKGTLMRGWAHAIADEAWKALTNNEGFFSSRLAYCKDSKNDNGHTIRKVYISDFDGTHEELLVDLPTVCIGPRWHTKKPRLFYSEYADTNVRLMSTSMQKQRKTISTSDGINMLANVSPDNSKVVYCSSRNSSGSCQIDLLHNNGKLKRFTNNTGNNVSPVFIDEDRICFCSDFQTGSPQIYIGNITTGHLQRITAGGYCTSPAYCPKTNKIVYHKMIHGTMQIMVYDCATKTHTQLTKTSGNKHEACWSPCGTLLLFAHENANNKSRLVSLNVLTNKTTYLTGANDQCSYPHWSPCYSTFPVVV